jgi:uncharacterized membrane-anchored protein
MSRRRRLVLLTVVAAQLLVPLALAGLAAADLAFGREVRLRAQPVDPLDIFRGNFVALRYQISTLPAGDPIERGDRVCTALAERGGVWEGEVALLPPVDGDTVICGRARTDADYAREVSVEYGIETYFASADRARELERALANGNVFAVLDLDDDGQARLERLEIE